MTAEAPLVEVGCVEEPVFEPWNPAPAVVVCSTVEVELRVGELMVMLRVMDIMPVPADAMVMLLEVMLLFPPDPGAIRVPPGSMLEDVELMDDEEDAEDVLAPPEMENSPL